MRTPLCRIPLLLILAGCLGGCAVHQPMSEMVALRAPRTPAAANADSRPRGFGLTAGATVVPQQPLLDIRYAMHPNPADWRISMANPRQIGGGFYWVRSARSHAKATALTVGVGAVGVDMTLRLSQRDYLTLGASALGGGQVIVQRRMTAPRDAGTLLGFAFRYSYHTFTEHTNDSEALILGPNEALFLASGGVRTVMVTRNGLGRETGTANILALYVGYAPRIGQPVVSLSVGLGTF